MGLNWNTSVKSQFGGTCWDFSSCGTLEAHYMLTRDDIDFQPDVSEQQNCWETSPDMGSTGGGWGTAVLDYSRTHGMVSEAECPHQPSSEDVGIAPYWPLATGSENRVWKSHLECEWRHHIQPEQPDGEHKLDEELPQDHGSDVGRHLGRTRLVRFGGRHDNELPRAGLFGLRSSGGPGRLLSTTPGFPPADTGSSRIAGGTRTITPTTIATAVTTSFPTATSKSTMT